MGAPLLTYTRTDLIQRQSLPLQAKIAWTENNLRGFVSKLGLENVYIAFSGGRDSTVLLHIARKLYPNIRACFLNTGLEYPEIVEFVHTFPNVDIIRPKVGFRTVLSEQGYPVISKAIAMRLHRMRNPERFPGGARLYATGYRMDGVFSPRAILPKKYQYLLTAPFPISDKCCDFLKKRPAHAYERATGRRPILGIMAQESRSRTLQWLQFGCNAFQRATGPLSNPMAFWTSKDAVEYVARFSIPVCSVYSLPGVDRTGCLFCLFGMEHDRYRFARLKRSHPRLWSYAVESLGIREVCTFLGYPVGDEPGMEAALDALDGGAPDVFTGEAEDE